MYEMNWFTFMGVNGIVRSVWSVVECGCRCWWWWPRIFGDQAADRVGESGVDGSGLGVEEV